MFFLRSLFVEGTRKNGHKVEGKEGAFCSPLGWMETIEMYFYRACNLIDTPTVFSSFYLCEGVSVGVIIFGLFRERK